VSVLNSKISGVEVGLKLSGGRVHIENTKVEHCAEVMQKSPDCELTWPSRE
jgi:hypothetical protein